MPQYSSPDYSLMLNRVIPDPIGSFTEGLERGQKFKDNAIWRESQKMENAIRQMQMAEAMRQQVKDRQLEQGWNAISGMNDPTVYPGPKEEIAAKMPLIDKLPYSQSVKGLLADKLTKSTDDKWKEQTNIENVQSEIKKRGQEKDKGFYRDENGMEHPAFTTEQAEAYKNRGWEYVGPTPTKGTNEKVPAKEYEPPKEAELWMISQPGGKAWSQMTPEEKQKASAAYEESKIKPEKPEPAVADDRRYREIQTDINLNKPVSKEDKAWAKSYEKQKTLASISRTDLPDNFSKWPQDVKEYTFESYRDTGIRPYLGSGFMAVPSNQQFDKEFAQWNIKHGGTGAEVVARKSQFEADTKSLAFLQRQADATDRAGRQLESMSILLERSAKALDNGDVRPLNAIKQKVADELNDPRLATFNIDSAAAGREWMKIVTGSVNSIAELSQTAQGNIEKFTDRSRSYSFIASTLKEMSKETLATSKSFHDQINEIRRRMKTPTGGYADTTEKKAETHSKLPPAKDYAGRTFMDDNGMKVKSNGKTWERVQ